MTTDELTITLTGRPPVKIKKAEWGVIASAKYSSCPTRNGTPVPDYEQDHYRLTVREHDDNRRVIVYAVLDTNPAWTHSGPGRREGKLVVDNDDSDYSRVADVIREVGELCELPDHVIRACIADLPAEEL